MRQGSTLQNRLLDIAPKKLMSAYSFTLPEVERVIASVKNTAHAPEDNTATFIVQEYYSAWTNWLKESPDLDFSGCQLKKHWAICNGIHDALVQQINYVSTKFKHFYTFQEDYHFYGPLLSGKPHTQITPEEIERISPNSYVILSIPHHSGFIPDWLPLLVRQCELTDSRIFLDGAFWGTIEKGQVDTSLAVFDCVAFSISKAFQAGGCRIGIAFSDNLAPSLRGPMLPQYNYWPINSVRIATTLLKTFAPSHMPAIGRPIQMEICNRLELKPCDVFFLAITKNKDYSHLKRTNADYSRLCLSTLIEEMLNDRKP